MIPALRRVVSIFRSISLSRRRWVLGVYWVLLACVTHWPRLQLQEPPPPGAGPPLLEVDKPIHAVAFGLLAALLAWARPLGRGASWRSTALLAGVVAGVYCVIDETTQGWVERKVSLNDLIANAIGVTTVYLLLITDGSCLGRSIGWRWVARGALMVAAPTLISFALLPGETQAVQWVFHFIEHHVGNPPDKAAHFYLAMVLTWLLAGAGVGTWVGGLSARRKTQGASSLGVGGWGVGAKWNVAVVVGVMTVSAPLIEVVQRLAATGREVEVADMTAHGQGVGVALLVWAGAAMLVSYRDVLERVWRVTTGLGGLAGGGGRDQTLRSRGLAQRRREEGESGGGMVGDAAVVSGLTLVSRLTGMVRDAVLAALLGTTWVADAFLIGFKVPNLFRRLFGEGALTAAFIPAYTDLRERDPRLAARFSTLVLTALATGLTVVTLLGELALWIGGMWPGWSEKATLAIEFAVAMLPYMPMICIVAFLGGVLQVHRKFGPPAAAPLMLNFAMIGGAGAAAWLGSRSDGDAARIVIAWAVAVSVLLAGAVQVVWQWAAVRRAVGGAVGAVGDGAGTRRFVREVSLSVGVEEGPIRHSWREDWGEMRGSVWGMARMMGPMVMGLAVFQINSLMDSLLAFGLSSGGAEGAGATHFTFYGNTIEYPIDEGGVAALQWAERLYQFPLGVFGIALATVIFPALAAAAARGDVDADGSPSIATRGLEAEYVAIVRRGLKICFFIGVPATVGMLLVGPVLVRTVYERGDFDLSASVRVSAILAGYASSIWAYCMTHVLTRAFYALKDAKTPLRLAMAMVGANFALNLILIWPLGAAGMAWATAITGAGQAVGLLIVLSRRTGEGGEWLANSGVWRSWGRTLAVTTAMVAVLGPVAWWVDPYSIPRWAAAAWLGGMVVVGAVIVLGGAWVAGMEELRSLTRRKTRGASSLGVDERDR